MEEQCCLKSGGSGALGFILAPPPVLWNKTTKWQPLKGLCHENNAETDTRACTSFLIPGSGCAAWPEAWNLRDATAIWAESRRDTLEDNVELPERKAYILCVNFCNIWCHHKFKDFWSGFNLGYKKFHLHLRVPFWKKFGNYFASPNSRSVIHPTYMYLIFDENLHFPIK